MYLFVPLSARLMVSVPTVRVRAAKVGKEMIAPVPDVQINVLGMVCVWGMMSWVDHVSVMVDGVDPTLTVAH